MTRKQLALLLALGAIWGSQFMFIKVAGRTISPLTVVWFRMALGTLTLLPVVLVAVGAGRAWGSARAAWRPLLAICLPQAVIGPALIVWTERRLDSGLTGVLQAAAPLFTALISLKLARGDRVTGARLLGMLVGLGGCALLVGAQPRGALLAAIAALLGALCGAIAAVVTARWIVAAGVDPIVTAFTSTAAATALLLPALVISHPGAVPGWKVTGSLLMLGIPGTGLAYLLFFRIVAGSGALNGMLVTYLVPASALFYGAVFLGEPVTAERLGGLALVLLGVALGTGVVGRRGLAPVPPSTP